MSKGLIFVMQFCIEFKPMPLGSLWTKLYMKWNFVRIYISVYNRQFRFTIFLLEDFSYKTGTYIWKIFNKNLKIFLYNQNNKHLSVLLKQWWLQRLNTSMFDPLPRLNIPTFEHSCVWPLLRLNTPTFETPTFDEGLDKEQFFDIHIY